MKKDITLIIGPTGIGKSSYAVSLAKQKNAAIISADAFQIYKYLTIGTAKILPEQQDNIPHYLIDFLSPNDHYSVGQFLKDVDILIKKLRANCQHIIICGGTAFYTHSFIYNQPFDSLKSDPQIRLNLTNLAKQKGINFLWETLHQVDPERAANIHPNNKHRIIRALELYKLYNKKPSQIIQDTPLTLRSDVSIIGLMGNKDIIDKKINNRVDQMIKDGFIDEVNDLLKKGFSKNCPGFRALGYQQVIDYLNGGIPLNEMIELIKVKTRQYAKKQITWYKKYKNVDWI
ncbi:tRNA (adenosine(37)-N6)-dimethylallyltransferase MiaA [Candidatus Marinamargulisbacteria bacterium SCGC AG-410-N11]|nr:tRNA (adenosine(37)-N6)-dimethylallyltransferase MiaA [Candidatus Marinamargulisbacteria bacterium SCGC AG-410-N11]